MDNFQWFLSVKKIKNELRKTGFYTQNQFFTILILFFFCHNSKSNIRKYLKISP